MRALRFSARTQKERIALRRGYSRHSGSALIEFAVIVPILLAITMMLVQFALFANANITLTQLAREGARTAAVGGNTNATIQTAVNNAAAAYGMKSSDLTIAITPNVLAERTPASTVSVTVSYDMNKRRFLPNKLNFIFFSVTVFSSTVTRSATMRVEGQTT